MKNVPVRLPTLSEVTMEGTFESVYLRLEWHMTTVTFSLITAEVWSVHLERMHAVFHSWGLLGSEMWGQQCGWTLFRRLTSNTFSAKPAQHINLTTWCQPSEPQGTRDQCHLLDFQDPDEFPLSFSLGGGGGRCGGRTFKWEGYIWCCPTQLHEINFYYDGLFLAQIACKLQSLWPISRTANQLIFLCTNVFIILHILIMKI